MASRSPQHAKNHTNRQAARMRGKFTTEFYWQPGEPLKSELMRHLAAKCLGPEGTSIFNSQFGLDCVQFNARHRNIDGPNRLQIMFRRPGRVATNAGPQLHTNWIITLGETIPSNPQVSYVVGAAISLNAFKQKSPSWTTSDSSENDIGQLKAEHVSEGGRSCMLAGTRPGGPPEEATKSSFRQNVPEKSTDMGTSYISY